MFVICFFTSYKAEYLVKDTLQDGARCAEEHIIFHMRPSASTISGHNSSQPTSNIHISTPEDDIKSTQDSFFDNLNATRQGQGSSSSANAIVVFLDYKKRPLQHWDENPFEFWSLQNKEGGFFFLFFLLPLNSYVCHLYPFPQSNFFSFWGSYSSCS